MIDLSTIGRPSIEFDLNNDRAIVVVNSSPNDRRLCPKPDERLISRHPVRARSARIGDRFDQVRFALAVSTDEQHRARPERDLGMLVVAEISEREMRDVHARQRSSRFGCSRYR